MEGDDHHYKLISEGKKKSIQHPLCLLNPLILTIISFQIQVLQLNHHEKKRGREGNVASHKQNH